MKLLRFLLTLILISILFGVMPAMSVQAESPASPPYASGDFLWAKNIGGSNDEQGRDIVTDSSGNVYTTGYFSGTVDFDPGVGTTNLTAVGGNDIFVSKLDSSGNFVWAKSIGEASNDSGYSIALDSSGNVYTTGSFSGTVDFDPSADIANLISAGNGDIFVSKLDSSGNFVWAKNMGGISVDIGYGIAIASSGDVLTTGGFVGTADFDPGAGISNLTSVGQNDVFISKLDGSGNFVWAKSMGGTSGETALGVTVDLSGNVYTTGIYSLTVDFDPGASLSNLTSAGGNDIFVSKLNSSGNFVWARSMGGLSDDTGFGISIDSSDNVYTTGAFSGTADFDPGSSAANLISTGGNNIFISKLDSNGWFGWAESMGGGSSSDVGFSITLDSNNNVYTTGFFSDTVDFDPAVGTSNLTSAGNTDIFVSKLDSDGDFVWARSMGGTSTDIAYGLALDSSGNIYTTGYFQGTSDFDPGTSTFNLTSVGINDIFVSKLESGVPGPCSPTIVVTNNQDAGAGSLRKAITDVCSEGIVTFDSALSGVKIYLASTLGIDKSITIDGSSLSSYIQISGDTDNNGTGDVSVFQIGVSSTVELNHLDIVKGKASPTSNGGGIANYGTLTIRNSTLSGNSTYTKGGAINNFAGSVTIENCIFMNNSTLGGPGGLYGGAVYNQDQMSITNSTFTGNTSSHSYGGSIANLGMLTLANSTISNNSASYGGGISNTGTLMVTKSTISGNSADIQLGAGGGILNDGNGVLTVTDSTVSNNSSSNGGGIFNLSLTSTVNLLNSTLSGNTVPGNGGGISNFGTLTVTNNTFFNNSAKYGGGIFSTGTLTVKNSTLSGNSATTSGGGIANFGTFDFGNTIAANSTHGEDCYNDNINGVLGVNINNIVENNAASPNQCGIPSLTLDPKLGPLANNGGSTLTMSLLPGSPAIDAGDDTTCASAPVNNTSQNGVTRSTGAHCDIGSFEAPDITPPTVSSITRASSDPAGSASVNFLVTFSESVNGVDTSDFSLHTTGVVGATISGVSGTGATRIVKVNTGSGDGTIRLDAIDDNTIVDLASNPLNGGFTTGETYTIDKPDLSAPSLRSPRNSVVINDTTPTFWWTAVRGGAVYEIEVATNNTFVTVIDTDIISGLSHTVAISLGEGNYFWHVRAYNASNQPGAWSSVRTFTVDTTGPTAPTLSFPINGASSNRTPIFKWTIVPSAVLYEFQYTSGSDINFASPIYTASVHGISRRPPAMKTGIYYWRVRAKDALGNWGGWSGPFMVTITRP